MNCDKSPGWHTHRQHSDDIRGKYRGCNNCYKPTVEIHSYGVLVDREREEGVVWFELRQVEEHAWAVPCQCAHTQTYKSPPQPSLLKFDWTSLALHRIQTMQPLSGAFPKHTVASSRKNTWKTSIFGVISVILFSYCCHHWIQFVRSMCDLCKNITWG